MTAPKHLTPEEKREYLRVKNAEYREKNRERMRELWRKYTRQKAEKRRIATLGDRKCPLCGIRLASSAGGHRKKVYCDDCWETQRKLIQRLATARWRRRQTLKAKFEKYEQKSKAVCVS